MTPPKVRRVVTTVISSKVSTRLKIRASRRSRARGNMAYMVAWKISP